MDAHPCVPAESCLGLCHRQMYQCMAARRINPKIMILDLHRFDRRLTQMRRKSGLEALEGRTFPLVRIRSTDMPNQE